jgi:hypothetical protein
VTYRHRMKRVVTGMLHVTSTPRRQYSQLLCLFSYAVWPVTRSGNVSAADGIHHAAAYCHMQTPIHVLTLAARVDRLVSSSPRQIVGWNPSV